MAKQPSEGEEEERAYCEPQKASLGLGQNKLAKGRTRWKFIVGASSFFPSEEI